MGFSEVFIFADKYNHVNPEIFSSMLLQAITNNFSLTYVASRTPLVWIRPNEDIDSWFLQLFSRQQFIEVSPWGCHRLATPV